MLSLGSLVPMKAFETHLMKNYPWLACLCGSLCFAANAQTIIHDFEYPTDDDLWASWIPSPNTLLSVSDSVAPASAGSKSMRAEFNFPQLAWATEIIRGPFLDSLLSIGPEQYLTFRIRGDAAFAAADFRDLYLYAYDEDNFFGRWGSAVPITDEWQVLNYQAQTIGAPWDSPGLPDLSRILQFAFYQYGSEAAIEPYTATIYIDDLQVRDTPLVEFGPPASARELIDDFEKYADDAALMNAYSYQNSPAATVTTATLDSPAPQGDKALKLAIDFAPGQYPWGSVRSGLVDPFSFPTNGVVSFRLKGDPNLAAVADAGTVFWLSFYDKAGKGINYVTEAAPVISSDWTTLEARLEDFSDATTVDIGNIVEWRILVEGWEGLPESPEMSGAFYVDDIRITVPSTTGPALALSRNGTTFSLTMNGLTSGMSYDLRTSTNLVQWSTATTIEATSATADWSVTADQSAAFYQLVQP